MSSLDLNHPASLPLNRARTINETTPRERQRIWGLLDRCRLTIVDSPPEGMGVVYVTFLPWRPHGERWAYMGSSTRGWNLTYLGSCHEGSFIGAKRKHPRGDFIKVCVATLKLEPPKPGQTRREHEKPLRDLEEALQKQSGIRRTPDEPQHRDWLNVLAHGSGGALATREQASKGGKITGRMLAERERTNPEFRAKWQAARIVGGKIAGEKCGPAAWANMNRRQAELINDPTVWDEFLLPICTRPKGWSQKKHAARSGFVIADNVIVVPLAKPDSTRGNRSSTSKGSQWIVGALRLGVCRFSDIVAMRDAMFPGDKRYAGLANARNGLSRESAGGLFAIVCPESGRVLRGYGADEDRLTYRLGVGWLRGRVRSSGPLAYWKAP